MDKKNGTPVKMTETEVEKILARNIYIYTYVNGHFWNGLNLEILISRIQEIRERALNIKVN